MIMWPAATFCRNLQLLITCLLTASNNRYTLQLELIDLQCDSTLKEKFQSESIDKFYASLNESKFANLRKMAMKLLVLFGSTYICEQTFSTMNINKTNLRSNLTDVHVQSLLRISTSDMQPEFKQLVDNFDRPQMSH